MGTVSLGTFQQFGRVYDVIWTGTADRAGTCPSLLPNYARQSTLDGISQSPRSLDRGRAFRRDKKRRDAQYAQAKAETRTLWGLK